MCVCSRFDNFLRLVKSFKKNTQSKAAKNAIDTSLIQATQKETRGQQRL
jgi:hypothetical protein